MRLIKINVRSEIKSQVRTKPKIIVWEKKDLGRGKRWFGTGIEFDGKNKEGFTYYIIKKSNYLSKCLK